jgi:hypothetical protein
MADRVKRTEEGKRGERPREETKKVLLDIVIQLCFEVLHLVN